MSLASPDRPLHAAARRARAVTLSMSLTLVLALCSPLALNGCASEPAEPPADAAAPAVVPAAAPDADASSGAAAADASADRSRSLGARSSANAPPPTASPGTATPAERQALARQQAQQADQATQRAQQEQCSQLRTEIREAQIDEQQAPNTSINEQIVQAKEAHADQHIQQLQDQYDSLDCTSVVGPQSRTPVLPVAPAPSGLSPPGAQGVPGVP